MLIDRQREGTLNTLRGENDGNVRTGGEKGRRHLRPGLSLERHFSDGNPSTLKLCYHYRGRIYELKLEHKSDEKLQ